MKNLGLGARFSLIGLVVLLVASCGTADSSSAANPSKSNAKVNVECLSELDPMQGMAPALPINLTSITGESVTVTSIDRVVSLAPGSAEIIWALGLGDVIAGKDLVSVYPGSEQTPTVNPGHEVAIELVLSLDPTLVLADKSEENSDAVTKLTELGIPVVEIPAANSISEISPRITAVANALGVNGSGDALASETETKLEQASSVIGAEKTIAFLYLRGNAGVYLIGGKESGADAIIGALGARDAGTLIGVEGFAPLTAESLAKANPDILMVMNEGLESVGGIEKLLALPGISSTSAGRNSAVIQADDRVLLTFGPQTPNVVTCLAEQLASFNELA
jgi:iron complex transport system substrate-binding protein